MLLLEIVLAPALIGLATWLGRRFGPAVGGWLVALPLTSGPVVLILALTRGPVFAEQVSRATLLALSSLTAFALAYGWAARRSGWIASTTIACLTYLACTLALRPVSLGLFWTFLAQCAVILVALRLMPISSHTVTLTVPPRWDVPARMILAAAMVLALSTLSARLGPQLSGLLTPFPIAATLLAAFTHHQQGSAAVAQLLRGLLAGLFSFAVFFLIIGAAIAHRGILVAFTAASLGAMAFHAGAWQWLDRVPSGGTK